MLKEIFQIKKNTKKTFYKIEIKPLLSTTLFFVCYNWGFNKNKTSGLIKSKKELDRKLAKKIFFFSKLIPNQYPENIDFK